MAIPEGIADSIGKSVAAGICGAARKATNQAPYLLVDSDVYFTDERGNKIRVKINGLWPHFTVQILFNELLVANYDQNAELLPKQPRI